MKDWKHKYPYPKMVAMTEDNHHELWYDAITLGAVIGFVLGCSLTFVVVTFWRAA